MRALAEAIFGASACALIMTMSFCVSVFKNVFVMVSLNVGALVSRISVTVVLMSL